MLSAGTAGISLPAAKGRESTLLARVESDLERLARSHDCWWMKVHGSEYQKAGTPDLLICWKGRFVGVELKRSPDEEPSEKQKWELRCIEAAGGYVAVVGTYEAWCLLRQRMTEGLEKWQI